MDKLAEDFDSDTVLFIGSGASIPSGLPSWKTLVMWLEDYTSRLGGNTAVANDFLEESTNDLINATSALTSELESHGKSLKDFFNDDENCSIFRSAEPKEIHHLIAELPTSCIVTPNYDLLIEKVYKSLERQIQVVHKSDTVSLNKIMRSKLKQYVYKYHGCVTMPDDIVFDFKSYRKEIHGNSVDLDCLKHLIQSKTLVFIGSDVNDPDFNHIRNYVTEAYNSSSLEFWAFMKNTTPERVKFYQKEYGINLISYDEKNGDHSDLNNKLKVLLKKIREVDERKVEDIESSVLKQKEQTKTVGVLRAALVDENEKIIPLDEQILGFAALFDTVAKEKLMEYLTQFRGYEQSLVSNRVEYLLKRSLLNETEHYYLAVKGEFSIEAAVQIEDDIMEFLMERIDG
ncbi:SIR2 family protein [Vibrio kyushuensis]|uniref:SIR2 family protein n=1 Tax=Vibrio kyushuensis TaxID=2910249 RepID=UPI003D0C009D